MSDSAVLDVRVCGAGARWCGGGGTPIDVVATTPVGTMTFDYASFVYVVGFDCVTEIWLTKGALHSLPRLVVWLPGNPILGPSGACGSAGPGDYSATLDFQDCDGQSLETTASVHVYANEITRYSEGGTEAHLDVDLKADGAGWHIDSRIPIPVLCGVGSTT